MEARGLFPFAGITEDPATGSAAGPLAAYMAREGVLAPGRSAWCSRAPQIGRPSLLTVAVSGAPEPSTTCASAARCSPSCAASSSSRTNAQQRHVLHEEPVSGRRPEGPRGARTDRCRRATSGAAAPTRASTLHEELVSGRRPEGPRGARTDTIGSL